MHFRKLFVDCETFYDTKAGYDLKSMSMTEYIRDPRFKLHGLAYRWENDEASHWISGDHVINAWVLSIDWKSVSIIAQNCKFDGAILSWRLGIVPGSWFDTQALGRAVLGENISGYSLKTMAEYLGLQAKGELKWDGVHTLTLQQEQEMASYCKGDVDICRGIYEKLIAQFPESQLSAMDWTIRAFVRPKLVLNQETLELGIQKERERRNQAIQESGVRKEVLSSNKQFAEHLQSLGVRVPTKVSGRTGKSIPAFARSDDGLERLRITHPRLWAGRIASKANLLETRGESLLAVSKTGPFPFDVGFSGAVQTHRYSGGSGAGGNPQNFTRKSFLREAVCASDAQVLVVGDFAAIELRILAWLAKEPKLISQIRNNGDVYADFAKLLGADRAFGKEAILGLGYNMGAEKFQARVKTVLKQEISDDESWRTVKLYRDTYFNVPKLWEACSQLIPLIAEGKVGCLYFAPFIKVQKGALVLPSGLSIQYPNLRSVTVQGRRGPKQEWIYDKYTKKYESEPVEIYGGKMVENICQALAGELCKEAIGRAESAGLEVVGQVHDEIIAVCKSNDAAEAAQTLTQAMQQSPAWFPDLKLKAEVKHAQNWHEAK